MRKIILTPKQKDDVLKLYNEGKSRRNISQSLNISEHVVRKFIEQNKLSEKPYKYVGTKFGRLTVIERTGTATNNAPIVKCQCDCGTIKNIIITNLTGGGTISCGCYNATKSILPDPWPSEFKEYIRQNEESRAFDFQLTLDQFKLICCSPCFYCNVQPHTDLKTGDGSQKRNGIDRVDSKAGYILSNCVPCCWICNRMKNDLPQSYFLNHVKLMYNNLFQE